MVQGGDLVIPKATLTGNLDAFLKTMGSANKASVVYNYLLRLPIAVSLSQLLQAELAYLFFQGPDCPNSAI